MDIAPMLDDSTDCWPLFNLFFALVGGLAVAYVLKRRQHLPRQAASQLREAAAHLAAGRYAESIAHYEEVARQGALDAKGYRQFILAYANNGDSWKALLVSRTFQRDYKAAFSDRDAFIQAELFSRTDQLLPALEVYTALLTKPIPYLAAYNNRGYTYNLLGEYALAIPDFDRAIAAGSVTAYAYNNRGFARLHLGQTAEALADIERSLQLDAGNAYAHRNLGIYYFNQAEYWQALTCFEQAQRLDWDTPLVAGYLTQTRRQLGIDGELPLSFSDN